MWLFLLLLHWHWHCDGCLWRGGGDDGRGIAGGLFLFPVLVAVLFLVAMMAAVAALLIAHCGVVIVGVGVVVVVMVLAGVAGAEVVVSSGAQLAGHGLCASPNCLRPPSRVRAGRGWLALGVLQAHGRGSRSWGGAEGLDRLSPSRRVVVAVRGVKAALG